MRCIVRAWVAEIRASESADVVVSDSRSSWGVECEGSIHGVYSCDYEWPWYVRVHGLSDKRSVLFDEALQPSTP